MRHKEPANPVSIPPLLQATAAFSWRFLVSVLALALIVIILARLAIIVVPLIIALLFTTISGPPAQWLKSKGWPSALASAVVMLTAVGALAALSIFMVPRFVDQIDQLVQAAQSGIDQVTRWLRQGPLNMDVGESALSMNEVRDFITDHLGSVLGGALLLIQLIAGLVVAAVLAFFFTHDGPQMWAWIVERFSKDIRGHVDEMGREAWTVLGAYIRGTAIVGAIDAIGIGLALMIIGVPLVLPLMVITFFGAFFPLVGAFVAGLLSALVALVSGGWVEAALVVGATVLVQQIEGNLLQPLIVGRTVKLHPVAVIVAIAAGGVLGGIAGAFLAVPALAVALRVGGYMRAHQSEVIPRHQPEADRAA